MANRILVLGNTGTGKSRSIKSLNPKETFIVNGDLRNLPWPGSAKVYRTKNQLDAIGSKELPNMVMTRNYNQILNLLDHINVHRPEIKNIVIDSMYYIILEEFMSRASEAGYTKYSEMALHFWQVMKKIDTMRNDIFVFVLGHTDTEDFERVLSVPGGKMIKDKIKPQGISDVVLESHVSYVQEVGNFQFLTQHGGDGLAKAPEEMFPSRYIPNDLQYVRDTYLAYYQGEQTPLEEEVKEEPQTVETDG